MCTPDYAQDYRVRAANARADGNAPVADFCDEQAREHERLAVVASQFEGADLNNAEHEWIHSPAFEQRLRASIARLEARNG